MKPTHFKIEFGFGLDYDRNGQRLSPEGRRPGLFALRDLATTIFGGCTLLNTEGDWFDTETKILHSEAGGCIVVYVDLNKRADCKSRILWLKEAIKARFNQAAVAVCISKVTLTID